MPVTVKRLREALSSSAAEATEGQALKPNLRESLRFAIERDVAPLLTQKAVYGLLREARSTKRWTCAAVVIAAASFVVALLTLVVVLRG